MSKALTLIIIFFSFVFLVSERIPDKQILKYSKNYPAIKLYKVLDKATKLPEYQRRYSSHLKRWITFCNIFARDILDNRDHQKYSEWFGVCVNDYSYDVSMLFPKPLSILMYRISITYTRAKNVCKKKLIQEVSISEAQRLANKGIPIWIISKKFNHEAIVCPSFREYDPSLGCLIAQAGYYNGIFYISDERAFGKFWKNKDIKFYKFKELKSSGKRKLNEV